MDNLKLLLVIFVGGGLGATLRYTAGNYIHELLQRFNFPYGTIAVNILGCLLIGFLGGFFDSREYLSTEVRAFLIIGMLGGFTTFSSFGFETFKLLQESQIFKAFINVFASITFGILAVFAGYILSIYANKV